MAGYNLSFQSAENWIIFDPRHQVEGVDEETAVQDESVQDKSEKVDQNDSQSLPEFR